MNTINYRVSLDMFDTLSQATIKAKKGDSACKIYITLTQNGKLFQITEGCLATFCAKKSDGNFIYDDCSIESDSIVYDFTSSVKDDVCQVTACEGTVECEVALYKGAEKLTSPRFTLVVDGTVYNGEDIVSTDSVNVLDDLIKEANQTITEIEEKLENGEFNGKDGADGKDGVDGEDYVLTEDDKREIADIVADSEKIVDAIDVKVATVMDESFEDVLTTANTSAVNAENYANSALQCANEASEHAGNALSAAQQCDTKLSEAITYAGDVWGEVEKAEAAATLAQRYAVGGTGTVEGEDFDNAKAYYISTKGASDAINITLTLAEGYKDQAAAYADQAKTAAGLKKWQHFTTVEFEKEAQQYMSDKYDASEGIIGVFVKVYIPKANDTPNFMLRLLNTSQTEKLRVQPQSYVSASNDSYGQVKAELVNGMWDGWWTSASSSESSAWVSKYGLQHNYAGKTDADLPFVYRFIIGVANGKVLPAGTKMEVWVLK